MKTREQVDAAIEDLSTIVKVSKTHRDSFGVIVEYIQQVPESDAVVEEEIANLLHTWDSQTNKCGWVYTAFNRTYGLIQMDDPIGPSIVCSGNMTLTQLRDHLIEVVKPPVPTLDEVEAIVEGYRVNPFTDAQLDALKRYIANQRTLTDKT